MWPTLDWSLVMSLIALGISIITLPVWGNPLLEASLNTHYAGDAKALRFYVGNKPIKNRFLRFIGVIRQTTEIVGQISVAEVGSGKILLPSSRVWLHTDKERGNQVSLASFLPALIIIAFYQNEEAILIVGDKPLKNLDSPENIKLERGRYRATCTISYTQHAFEFSAEFVVGVTISDFFIGAVKNLKYYARNR